MWIVEYLGTGDMERYIRYEIIKSEAQYWKYASCKSTTAGFAVLGPVYSSVWVID